MIQEGVFTDTRMRSLHGLLLKMFVKFCDNVVVARHKIRRVITTMVRVEEAIDMEVFLASPTMHSTALIRVAKATEETHETWCLPGVWWLGHLHQMVSVGIVVVVDDDVVVGIGVLIKGEWKHTKQPWHHTYA